MDSLLQDIRYGFRMLIHNPGFTAAAVIALALGIGGNSAIFSVVNAVLLKPLGYKDADRLVTINHNYPKLDLKASVSAVGYTHYRKVNASFEDMAAFTGWPANLTESGEPERLRALRVTPSFFPTLGIGATMGRVFSADEDQEGREHVSGDQRWPLATPLRLRPEHHRQIDHAEWRKLLGHRHCPSGIPVWQRDRSTHRALGTYSVPASPDAAVSMDQ